MSWEGMHAWRDWPGHIGADDERGLATFHQVGTVLLREPGGHDEVFLPHFDDLGIRYEHWDRAQLRARLPGISTGRFGPAGRSEDEEFWDAPTDDLPGAIWMRDGGYVSDPQLAAHNLQRAAESHGGQFRFGTRVVEVARDGDRVTGVVLDDDTVVASPVVVNAAGPHSARVNALAGLADTMRIGTRPMRHEVHQVPAPASLAWERTGTHVGDDDSGIYLRPRPPGPRS